MLRYEFWLSYRLPSSYQCPASYVHEPTTAVVHEPAPTTVIVREPAPTTVVVHEPAPAKVIITEPTPTKVVISEPTPTAQAAVEQAPTKLITYHHGHHHHETIIVREPVPTAVVRQFASLHWNPRTTGSLLWRTSLTVCASGGRTRESALQLVIGQHFRSQRVLN